MGPGAGLGEKLEMCVLSEVCVRTGTYKPSSAWGLPGEEMEMLIQKGEGEKRGGGGQGGDGRSAGLALTEAACVYAALCLSYLLEGKLPEG